MNRSWFWFGIALGFGLLLFWKKGGSCGCSGTLVTRLANGEAVPSVLGGDFAAGNSGLPGGAGGAGSAGGNGNGITPCASCSAVAPTFNFNRPSAPRLRSIAGPGSYNKPALVGVSINSLTNINNQLSGRLALTPNPLGFFS